MSVAMTDQLLGLLAALSPWVALLCLGIVIGDWLDRRGYTRGIGDL